MANKSVGLLTIAFGADLRGFDKAMKKAQRSIKKFGTSMKNTGQNLTRNLTLPLAAFAAASVKAFDTQAKAEIKLLTALKGREDIQQRLISQAKELQTPLFLFNLKHLYNIAFLNRLWGFEARAAFGAFFKFRNVFLNVLQ